MITTIFGDLEWGDDGSLEEFLSNHYQSHIDLNAALANTGINFQTPFLARKPDNDWFADHYLLHQALDRALNAGGFPGLSNGWGNAATFYDWMNINNNAHIAYAQLTGVE